MQNLLLSRYGMSTALEIRRLRQLLRQREAANGGRRSSQELLEACLQEPELAAELGKPAFGLQRLLKMYTALNTELASGTATPKLRCGPCGKPPVEPKHGATKHLVQELGA